MVWLAGRGVDRRGKAGRNGWPRMANKAEEEPRLARWLKAGCRFELHAWGLKGARGKRKTYQLTRQSAQLTVHGIVWRDEDDASSEGLRIL